MTKPCYHCMDGRHEHCVGVPCPCPCPSVRSVLQSLRTRIEARKVPGENFYRVAERDAILAEIELSLLELKP